MLKDLIQELPTKPNFLVVDDEEELRYLLKEFLKTYNLQVEEADSEKKALEIFKEKGPFTILITDIVMPGGGGLTLIQKIKEISPETMILAMTGYARNYGYVDVVAAGADDLIQKPFSLEELEARLARIIREWTLKEKLKALSIRDALTEIFNRRHFEERLQEETYRALRQGYPLCLFMIDVDHFKLYNDTRGHREGDILLKSLADILCRYTREKVDQPFRYGGDEFVVLLPYTDLEEALKVAQRILNTYRERDFNPTTLSIGIAKLIPQGSARKSADDLVRRADKAMYRAKNNGGNQIEIDPESKKV